MVIIDRKKIIIKKIVIGAVVLIVLLAAGFAVWNFLIKAKKTAPSAKETSNVPSVSSPVEMNGTDKPADVPPEDEAGNKFSQERWDCIQKFSGLENMKTEEVQKLNADIVSLNSMGARNYYVCLAVKNDDSKYCDALKADGEGYAFCQNEYLQVSGMKFPALKLNSCDQKVIDACKKTGGTDADCQIICQGLYLGNIDECNKLEDGNSLKSACLAIDQKDINVCSALKNTDDQGICREEYYFVRAVKENNPSLLDNIENVDERTITNLYFDKNYKCERMLSGFGQNGCDRKYNIDYLQTLRNSAKDSQTNN